MKARFDRVTINVKNLEEAKAFFSNLLKTTFEDQPDGILEKIEIIPRPDSFVKFKFAISPIGIELFQPDPPPEKEGIRNITWRVHDIEDAKEEMREKGISHVFDMKCGGWKEAVYSEADMHGIRWVLNEYGGDSVFKAMLQS